MNKEEIREVKREGIRGMGREGEGHIVLIKDSYLSCIFIDLLYVHVLIDGLEEAVR